MLKRAQAVLNAGHHVPSAAERKKTVSTVVDTVPEEDNKSDCKTPLQVHSKKKTDAKKRKLSDGGHHLEIESNRKNNRSEARHPETSKGRKEKDKGAALTRTVETTLEPSALGGEAQPAWMSYFDSKEFEAAVIQSTQKKPEIEQHDEGTEEAEDESDSEPSCDNFGEDEIVHNFEIAMEAEERERQGELANQHQENR